MKNATFLVAFPYFYRRNATFDYIFATIIEFWLLFRMKNATFKQHFPTFFMKADFIRFLLLFVCKLPLLGVSIFERCYFLVAFSYFYRKNAAFFYKIATFIEFWLLFQMEIATSSGFCWRKMLLLGNLFLLFGSIFIL